MMHVDERIEERMAAGDPVGAIEAVWGSLPDDQLLGPTIKDIAARAAMIGMTEQGKVVLTRAKNARNFIAHDAKEFGTLYSVKPERVGDFIERLRAAVADVAVGDDFISRIIFRVEEPKAELPYHPAENYADLMDLWVFGHLIDHDAAMWGLLFHQGLPDVPPVPRRDIHLPASDV